MISAICTKTCTTPQHGFVEKGEPKTFDDIDKWDEEKYPYLKYFKSDKAKAVKVQHVEAELEKKERDAKEETFDDDDHIVAALGKRVIAMEPDELDKVGAKAIGEAYGITWAGRKKDDVVLDAIKKDKGE